MVLVCLVLGESCLSPPVAGEFDATCDAAFGSADTYELCRSWLPDTGTNNMPLCEFYVETHDDTCAMTCEALGGSCVDGWDNLDSAGDCTHDPTGHDGCNDSHSSQICTCTPGP